MKKEVAQWKDNAQRGMPVTRGSSSLGLSVPAAAA
jgi:hypothetical protein